MARTQKSSISPEKARQILREGEINGKPLTKKQKGFFGLVAGGGKPTRLKKKERSRDRRA